MTGVTETVLSHMYPWPIGVLVTASAVSFVFGAVGVWALWRARRLLAVLPSVQDRLDTLSNSVAMLNDTTESCFKALAMQLQFMQAQHSAGSPSVSRVRAAASETSVEAGARKGRQRRVVGAARRGEAVDAIAAREDVAEAEVALRLHLNNQGGIGSSADKRHGVLHS